MISTKTCQKVALMILCLLPVWSMAQEVRIDYAEPLEQLQLIQSTRSAESEKPGERQSAATIDALQFSAFGKFFDVRVSPNQYILTQPVRDSLSSDIGVFRGRIDGMPGSWVRLVVIDDIPRGLVWDGTTMYAIEVSDKTAVASIFRLDDLYIPPGALTCGQSSNQKTAADLLKAVTGDFDANGAQAPGADSFIDMGIVADFEFASDKGSAAQSELITRMNNLDGIFSEQLGVQLNIGTTDIFSSSNDPFTDETDSGNLLDELTEFRADSAAQRANGLTHMFTGRNLDGSTVGVAYVGALCSSSFGVGLTQATNSASVDTLIAAHELGHNFGAPHDGTSGSACESTAQDFLMAPRVNGSDTFSACSVAEMRVDINRASCISALPTLDVAVEATQPGNTLLGDSATVSFVVNNVGTEDADSVSIEVSIPSGAALDSVSSSRGSCSSGGGTANCSIGLIDTGSSATVDLGVTSLSAGNTNFTAIVTVPDDDNANNNNATLTLSVERAVDLVASAATAAVVVDRTSSASVTIANQSSIAATNTVVTINPGNDIRIDSGSWPAGNCSVAGGVLSCESSSLAAQSSNTITVQLAGLAVGSTDYSVSVSATETDRNSSNNSAQGQVNVGEAPVDSGGGAFSLLSLCMLLLLISITLAANCRSSLRQTIA